MAFLLDSKDQFIKNMREYAYDFAKEYVANAMPCFVNKIKTIGKRIERNA